MPSTHSSLHYHIVFSTKNRVPSIRAEWRDRLHAKPVVERGRAIRQTGRAKMASWTKGAEEIG